MKIKDEVRIVQSSSASNVPCTSTLPSFHSSPKSPPPINTTKESMTRKVLSPLVARRRGRPCTKCKVSKVDEIVNLLKGKNKKANPVQGRKVRQGEPRKLSFPCMGAVQHTMYEPVPPNQPYYCPSMDAIEDSMYVPCQKIDLTICLVWMPHKTVFMYRHRLAQLGTTLEAHLILKLEWSTILAVKVR